MSKHVLEEMLLGPSGLAERERQRELEHEQKLAEIRNRPNENPTEHMVWTGTKRDFGDLVKRLFRDGRLRANSLQDAMNQACEHFADKDGKPLNAASILQSHRNRHNANLNKSKS